MANNKKMVEAITSMDEDFAQWYTDIVKKAELSDYSSVKGCMIIKPAGYAIAFIFCAVAYVVAWCVMKALVPKYKPIADR